MGHVLVVDDDKDIRESITQALEDDGYLVTTAWNGEDALAKLGSMDRQPCLVLLDLMMPRMNGLEFLTELQTAHRLETLPVIVMTAHPTANPPSARGLLRKPVGLGALLDTVKVYCQP